MHLLSFLAFSQSMFFFCHVSVLSLSANQLCVGTICLLSGCKTIVIWRKKGNTKTKIKQNKNEPQQQNQHVKRPLVPPSSLHTTPIHTPVTRTFRSGSFISPSLVPLVCEHFTGLRVCGHNANPSPPGTTRVPHASCFFKAYFCITSIPTVPYLL